jgi:hypothetical protein
VNDSQTATARQWPFSSSSPNPWGRPSRVPGSGRERCVLEADESLDEDVPAFGAVAEHVGDVLRELRRRVGLSRPEPRKAVDVDFELELTPFDIPVGNSLCARGTAAPLLLQEASSNLAIG